ncbi:MAG: isoaspartyl peptidase/L-asparaginase [Pseudonocardiaceae bacterium]
MTNLGVVGNQYATPPVLVVHGGAGRIVAEELGAQRTAAARRGLGQSLAAGMTVLRDGGSALDAVVAAVRVLEEDEQFNAGRGVVLTADGGVERGRSAVAATSMPRSTPAPARSHASAVQRWFPVVAPPSSTVMSYDARR